MECNVNNLKQKVNFCSSSLSQKQKWCDKHEPHEIVKIGEAIGVCLGLSLDLVFKDATRGLLRTFCRSLVVVVVVVAAAVSAAAAAAVVVVVVVVVPVVVMSATGTTVDWLQLLVDLIFKRYCVFILWLK
jgi:hypothetical protein